MENQATLLITIVVRYSLFMTNQALKRGYVQEHFTWVITNCQSYYRNPINTEVSAVVIVHHMALLADHANGRIRRERVFRDHNDLLVHKNMYL